MPELHNNKCNAMPKLQNNRKEEITNCKRDVMEKKNLLQVNNGHKDFVQTIANLWCLLDDYCNTVNRRLLKFSIFYPFQLGFIIKIVSSRQHKTRALHNSPIANLTKPLICDL